MQQLFLLQISLGGKVVHVLRAATIPNRGEMLRLGFDALAAHTKCLEVVQVTHVFPQQDVPYPEASAEQTTQAGILVTVVERPWARVTEAKAPKPWWRFWR
jgi:hypothetical protein